MLVLNPIGVVNRTVREIGALPPLASLDGKVLGFLDNSKPKADALEAAFEQRLRERFNIAGIVRKRKLTAQQGAPAAMLDELAQKADVIINGLGD